MMVSISSKIFILIQILLFICSFSVLAFGTNVKPPVLSPTKAPIKPPVSTPMCSPKKPPQSTPMWFPTQKSVSAPIWSSTKSPMSTPMWSPTRPPMSTSKWPPTKSPISAPMWSPTKPPMWSPTKPPMSIPMWSPTKSPMWSPTKSPVSTPIWSPTKAPVKPPVYTPIHAPSHAPAKPPAHHKRFIAVQGVVYCISCKDPKSGSLKKHPIKGAIVRLTCHNNPNKTVIQEAAAETDKKGHFFIQGPKAVTNHAYHKCIVQIISSPNVKCETLTNINKGSNGAHLRHGEPFIINDLPFLLYNVGPFAFSPKCF